MAWYWILLLFSLLLAAQFYLFYLLVKVYANVQAWGAAQTTGLNALEAVWNVVKMHHSYLSALEQEALAAQKPPFPQKPDTSAN